MPMTFQGASFVTSEGGQADNEATDSKTAPSSSENSDDDDATTGPPVGPFRSRGWLAANSRRHPPPPGNPWEPPMPLPDGRTELAELKLRPILLTRLPPRTARPPNFLRHFRPPLHRQTLRATTSLATSLMPAAADAPPAKAEAATLSADPSAKKSAAAPADSTNSITSPKELSRLATPTPESPSRHFPGFLQFSGHERPGSSSPQRDHCPVERRNQLDHPIR